jgi:hypothetical protein
VRHACVRGDAAAYLVAEPAEDAGADGGDAGVADVPAEAAPRPHGDEDADHLLAHDAPEHALSVIHGRSLRRVFSILHAPPAVQCVPDQPLPLHGCRSLLGAEHAPRIQRHHLLEPAPYVQINLHCSNLTTTLLVIDHDGWISRINSGLPENVDVVGAGLGVQPILQVKIIRRRLAADVPRAGEHPASTTVAVELTSKLNSR